MRCFDVETNEQFIRSCGKYKRVEDIPAHEREEMLKRINVDGIDRHRNSAREHQRIYTAKRRASRHAQSGMA